MTKRNPAQYDWTNALFNDRRLTKHFTHPRRSKISHVTLHHMTIVSTGTDASNKAALEGCYTTWQSRPASANYGVAGDQVWQFVSDNDAPWSDADGASNHSTLSIEHANSTSEPTWKIGAETMATGAHLVATLHRLYGLGRPSRKTVRMHRDYYSTACPGPYMVAHLNDYIAAAQRFYDGTPTPKPPAPVEPTEPKPQEPTVPTPCTFNFLGWNIYASQYTGNKFSATRQAGIKAVFADARASLLGLSEINLAYDHNKIVSLLGAQFNHSDTYVRAKGNNHLYPDANKWLRTGFKEIDLLGKRQYRRVTLATYKHKGSGKIVSSWAAHFSSAAGFRAAGMSSAAASKQAAADQIAEAKALAKIIAGKPLPDWNVDTSIGYLDSNMANAGRPYLDGHGTTSVYDLVTVGNAAYGSLHTLGSAPAKDGKHIDDVRVGKNVKVNAARQIVGQKAYDASDHIPLAVQVTVS